MDKLAESLRLSTPTISTRDERTSGWKVEIEVQRDPNAPVVVYLRFGDAATPAHYAEIPKSNLAELLAFANSQKE